MTNTVSHLLHQYGFAKFGDHWTPRRPDEWLDGNEGKTLRDLIERNDAANPETARLLNKLGQALFCDKWRPYDTTAEAIIGEEGVAKIREFFDIEPAPSMSM